MIGIVDRPPHDRTRAASAVDQDSLESRRALIRNAAGDYDRAPKRGSDMARHAARTYPEGETAHSHSDGGAGKLRRMLVGLSEHYWQAVWAIRSAFLNCLLTCVAGAVANLLYEGWSPHAWASLMRHICVGYAGAVVIVLLVLPWLARRSHGEADSQLSDFEGESTVWPQSLWSSGESIDSSVNDVHDADDGQDDVRPASSSTTSTWHQSTEICHLRRRRIA